MKNSTNEASENTINTKVTQTNRTTFEDIHLDLQDGSVTVNRETSTPSPLHAKKSTKKDTTQKVSWMDTFKSNSFNVDPDELFKTLGVRKSSVIARNHVYYPTNSKKLLQLKR